MSTKPCRFCGELIDPLRATETFITDFQGLCHARCWNEDADRRKDEEEESNG